MFERFLRGKDKAKTDQEDAAILFDPKELAEELDEDKIVVELQPQIALPDGSAVGAEALSRYVDENNNRIGPLMFLPILESASVVSQLDFAVVKRVTELLCRWKETGKTGVPVAINFSRVDFTERGFLEKVDAYFDEHGIDRSAITIEIRESAIADSYEFMYKKCNWLRERGYRIAIDDFGRENNILFRLGDLPVDIIKFDRAVLMDAMHHARGQVLMRHLVAGFAEAGYEVVCEGVETEEQCQAAAAIGIDRIQGFLYDRPMSVEAFEAKYI